jgi:hypothetical protein
LLAVKSFSMILESFFVFLTGTFDFFIGLGIVNAFWGQGTPRNMMFGEHHYNRVFLQGKQYSGCENTPTNRKW